MMKFRGILRPGWFVLSVLIAFSMLSNARTSLYKNLAYISFAKAFAPDHIQATERQERLERFLEYGNLDQQQGCSPLSLEISSEMAMLRSVFIGEYYRFQGNIDEAACWYLKAAQSTPVPFWQDSLVSVRRDKLSSDGSILIENFSDVNHWQVAMPTNVESAVFESVDGIASISYLNRPELRDRLAYSLTWVQVPLVYHTVLTIRAKLAPGAFLTTEVKVDGTFERGLDYHQGSGEWEELRVPLEGDMLQSIKFSFSEPGKPETTDEYKVWIDWIKLELASD